MRGCGLESLDSDIYFIGQKVRRDFPLMQERKEITFSCGNETLMGYLYSVDQPKGVIVCSHGVNSLADGTLAQFENYYISHGWDVFTIDMTGCGQSTGKGMKSLHESKYCVKNAIKTVKQYAITKDLPVFCIGHSWGAYGAIAGSDGEDIKAVAAFSGYNQPAQMAYGFAANYLSPALVLTKPALDMSMRLFYGNEAFVTASSIIKKNTDTQYVLIQGLDDDVVPYKTYSALSAVEKNATANSTLIKLDNVGHLCPWKSNEALNYFENGIIEEFDELEAKYKGNVPEDVYHSFIDKIDKEKSSEVNTALLDQIEQVFLNSL